MTEVLVFVLGVIVGSFLNVCIYRIPRGMSVVFPGSKCASCGGTLKFFDLVPLASYLMLKGRCRQCGAGISIRYFIVELLTGALFLTVFFRFGFEWQTLVFLILTGILITVFFIDYEFRIIPNRLVLMGTATALAANLAGFNIGLVEGIYGMILGGGFLGAVAAVSFIILKKEGMGGGDIKLMAMAGIFLGWQNTALSLVLAVFSAALVFLIMMALKRAKKGDMLPFGPFLASGIFVSALYGADIINWYLYRFLGA